MPLSATALELAMPSGSTLAFDSVTEDASFALPDSPYIDGYVSTRRVTGQVSKQVWQLPGKTATPEQMVAPLRSQFEAAGFAILLDCDADSCGGFDFRFSIDVVPAPDMYVDLVNYRFVSALKDTSSGIEAISVLASASEAQGFLQLIAVQPQSGGTAVVAPSTNPPVVAPSDTSTLQASLVATGHVVLSDLEFETGSSNLSASTFGSLRDLAAFMTENPAQRIALVGHTDNVGSLENNVALSQKRSEAVKSRLIEVFGIPADQIDATGVGYLAPLVSNLTDQGRAQNRRVEAVLLSQ